jgi:hypothetical protein
MDLSVYGTNNDMPISHTGSEELNLSLVTWTAAHHPFLSRQPFFATSTIPEAGIQYPGAEQALSRCCAGS